MNSIHLLFVAIISIYSLEANGLTIELGEKNLERIQVKHPSLYPEDIKYNVKTKRFIVGSFREGAVYEVDEQGNANLLTKDDRLVSTLGLYVDVEANRLYVTTSDLGVSIKKYGEVNKLAALGIYNLDTGEAVNFINLGKLLPEELHLANAITKDDRGNVYVTDSFSPVIYKIDANDNPSIFLKSDKFLGEGINLNGIIFHPNGYLIVIKKNDGVLFKVPLSNPENLLQIQLADGFIGGDGLILANKEELIITANRASGIVTEAVFTLVSDDDWETAKVINQKKLGDVYLTNGVIKDNKIYVMHSNINELVQASEDKKSKLNRQAIIQQIGTVTPR